MQYERFGLSEHAAIQDTDDSSFYDGNGRRGGGIHLLLARLDLARDIVESFGPDSYSARAASEHRRTRALVGAECYFYVLQVRFDVRFFLGWASKRIVDVGFVVVQHIQRSLYRGGERIQMVTTLQGSDDSPAA